MPINEQELGRDFEQSAGQVTMAWLPTGEMSRQIRRLRSRIIPAVAGPVVAAAAVAMAIGVALSASNWQPSGRRRQRTPQLSYTVTMNGRAQVCPGPDSEVPSYAVSPGENLDITVDVTVPEGVTVTALSLGITDGILAADRDGPKKMEPVLATCTDATLGPGAHRFSFSWAVPAELRPGATRQLAVQFAWRTQSSGLSQRFIAEFGVQAGPEV